MSYDATGPCERCHGNRAEPGTPIETCERCGGSGQLRAVSSTPFGQIVRATVCDVCNGEGKTASTPCSPVPRARAHGGVRRLSVEVPAGIEDGQRVRLAGRGHGGEAGGPPGDLYVLVRVREDERFLRDGSDLVTVVDVPAPAAALGTRVAVPSLDGDREVELSAGTQPGDTLRLAGRGLPSLRRGPAGDLRVVVNVVVPRNLTGDQREITQRLLDSLSEENLRSQEGVFAKLKRVMRA